MTFKHFLLSLMLLQALICDAQLYEHAIQSAFQSSYESITHLPNGNIAFLERRSTIGFGQYSFLVEMDPSGLIIREDTLNADSLAPAIVNHFDLLPDGSQLLIGLESIPCDVGYPRIKVQRIDSIGQSLWSKIYGLSGYPIYSREDSSFILHHLDSTFIVDLNGLVTDTIFYPSTNYSYAKLLQNSVFLFDSDGIKKLSNGGAVLDSLEGVFVNDLAENNNGQIICLSSDSILLLSAQLVRTGLGQALSGWNPRRLVASPSMIAGLTQSKVDLFDHSLNFLSINNLSSLPDWTSKDAILGDSIIHVVGSQGAYGSSSSAYLQADYFGLAAQASVDALLLSTSIDSADYTISYPQGSGIAVVSGDFWASSTISNLGSDTIHTLTINDYLPYGFCEVVGHSYRFDNLTLLPGSSITLSSGPHYIYHTPPDSQPFTGQLCTFISGVNNRLEADNVNNRSCGPYTFPVGIEELKENELSLYPNPASEFVMLSIANPNELISTEIFDVQGHVVRSFGNESSLDLAGLSPAVYLIRTRTGSSILHSRLIVE